MNKFMKRMANKQRKGFTLVELVVVILIIAILAAAIFLGGATVIKQAREAQVKSDLRNMATYVQDMLYENPQLQYHQDFYDGEFFTYDANDKKFSGESNVAGGTGDGAEIDKGTAEDSSNVVIDDMTVLTLLNTDYMTDDFQIGTVVDAWDNPYLWSYDQIRSEQTGDASSCIIVISSLGVNTIDESSDGAKDVASVTANTATADAAHVADQFDADMLAKAGAGQKAYASAEEYIAMLGKDGTYNTQDDYGVVIVMIDGQVSTAYYGF